MNLNRVLLLAALLAGPALAQAPIGTVTEVQGVVAGTQGATTVTVAPGTAIQNGMRFVTTSGGSVTLRLANGCTVTVPPGHGVTVLSTMTCQQLTAAVQPVVPVAAPGPFLAPSPAVIGGAVAAGLLAILISTSDDNDEAPLSAR